MARIRIFDSNAPGNGSASEADGGFAAPFADDVRLVHEVVRGDAAARARFEARIQAIVRHCLRRARARNPSAGGDDRDALQSFELLLFEDRAKVLQSYRGRASLTTWIHAIATRHCSNELARERASRLRVVGIESIAHAPDLRPSPEESRADDETHAELKAAIARLRDEDRLLIALIFEQDAPAKVVARSLDISEGAVRVRKLRILKKLSKLLGGREP